MTIPIAPPSSDETSSPTISVFYYVALAICRRLSLTRSDRRSRFGRVLRGAKDNETRMKAIGFDPFRIASPPTHLRDDRALAGYLLAEQAAFVSPAFMTWQRSGDLIIMVMLGGLASLEGAVLGAVAVVLTEEALSGLTTHWQAIFGPCLVLVALFARGGVLGFSPAGAMAEAILSIDGLNKSFGALRVTDDVTLDLARGELHALIGPNGAGKTSLIISSPG